MFVGGVVIQNLPEEGCPASFLLAAGSAVSVVGTRFLRTLTAAIKIESGFAGEVVIDPSVTNLSYFGAPSCAITARREAFSFCGGRS